MAPTCPDSGWVCPLSLLIEGTLALSPLSPVVEGGVGLGLRLDFHF